MSKNLKKIFNKMDKYIQENQNYLLESILFENRYFNTQLEIKEDKSPLNLFTSQLVLSPESDGFPVNKNSVILEEYPLFKITLSETIDEDFLNRYRIGSYQKNPELNLIKIFFEDKIQKYRNKLNEIYWKGQEVLEFNSIFGSLDQSNSPIKGYFGISEPITEDNIIECVDNMIDAQIINAPQISINKSILYMSMKNFRKYINAFRKMDKENKFDFGKDNKFEIDHISSTNIKVEGMVEFQDDRMLLIPESELFLLSSYNTGYDKFKVQYFDKDETLDKTQDLIVLSLDVKLGIGIAFMEYCIYKNK